MAYLHPTSGVADVQIPPVVRRLQAIFAVLNDAPLLAQLQGKTRRGPKGYPMAVLWRCYVAKYALGIPSTVALIRTLCDNPYIALACGIDWPTIPHEATFSRFFAKLTRWNTLPKLKDVSRSLVRDCYRDIPGFGKRVAIDSTTIKGWANGAKGTRVDPDGGWSVKVNTQGKEDYTFGFKLHLLVDCESELPIGVNISAGNIHDSQRASHVLGDARHTAKFHPQYVIADKGYSGRPLRVLIHRQYRAWPIIQTNPGHKRLMETVGIAEKTPEWKAIYSQRTAVERVFSRLKGQHSLNRVTNRRLRKVTAHCYLALLALQASHRICGRSDRVASQELQGRLFA